MAGHTNPDNPTRRRNRWHRASTCETSASNLHDNPFMKSFDTQIVLEHVLGMTVYSNSALASDPRSGVVAYPASCVVVLLDSVKNKQVGTLKAPRKSITAVSFSCDGRFVLTGESGLQPAVRVWSMSSLTEVAVLRGHSFGIKTAVFSPRMREIIVVGDAQDMMISVWAWPNKVMNSLNKFSDEIYAMDVSANSLYFVTVGNKHVKFYYLETKRTHSGHDPMCPIPLTCRYGMLDNLKENCFCDVACGQGDNCYVFVITTSGILCQINSNRFLERWVNVNLSRASSLSCDGQHVFVGGCQGIIRMFDAFNLQIVLTLPRPHCLGLDISQVTTQDGDQTESPFNTDEHHPSAPSSEDSEAAAMAAATQNANASTRNNACFDSDRDIDGRHDRRHPGVVALTFDPRHQNVTVVYEDHSLYIWRRVDLRRESEGFCFQKRYSSMYHRGGVWDLTTYPVAPPTMPGEQTDSLEDDIVDQEVGGAFPPGALLSVSADGTLRVWDVNADICQESVLKRNSVSPQCLKIVYGEKQDQTCQRKQPDTHVRRNPKSSDCLSGVAVSRHKKQGFTVVSVCPTGVHIATGNRHGRVSIYDTNSMHVTATMHAHEAEITALAYSITQNYKVLASGSRDRMIHVMDASRGYQLLTTLDDHSSTITAINFTYISNYMIMATSSLDMSVLVRVYMGSESFILNPVRAIVEKKSITDFAIHPWSGSLAFACQDRFVRVYSIMTSTDHYSFRGCPSYGGQLVKVQFDPSGQYLLTACSLKTINLLQYTTGTLLSTFSGHAESITSVRFSHNVKHVISAAVDGCIFLWRLPEGVTYAVKKEMAEMGRLTRAMVFKKSWKKSSIEGNTLPKPTVSEPALSSISDRHPRQPRQSFQPPPAAKADSKHREMAVVQGRGFAMREAYNSGQETAEKRHKTESHVSAQGRTEQVITPKTTTRSGQGDEEDVECEGKVKEEPQHQVSIKFRFNQSDSKNVASIGENYKVDFDQTPVKQNAWLSACCERRRIFKLEARSIKKILSMMRLVTDAMEKDLANAGYVISSSPCPPPCLPLQTRHSSCETVSACPSPRRYSMPTGDVNNTYNATSSHHLNENRPSVCAKEDCHFLSNTNPEARPVDSQSSQRVDYETERSQKFYIDDVQEEPDGVPDTPSTHISAKFERLFRQPKIKGRRDAEEWSSTPTFYKDETSEYAKVLDKTERGSARQPSEKGTIVQPPHKSGGFTNSLYNFCMSCSDEEDQANNFARLRELNFTTSNGHCSQKAWKNQCQGIEETDDGTNLCSSSMSVIHRPGFLLLSSEPIVLNAMERLRALMNRSVVETVHLAGSAELFLETNTSETTRNTMSYSENCSDDDQGMTNHEDTQFVTCGNNGANKTNFDCTLLKTCIRKEEVRCRIDESDSDTDSYEDLIDFDTRRSTKESLMNFLGTSERKIKHFSNHLVSKKKNCQSRTAAEISSLVVDYQPFWSFTREFCQRELQEMTSSESFCLKRCKSDTEIFTSNYKSVKLDNCVNFSKLIFSKCNPSTVLSIKNNGQAEPLAKEKSQDNDKINNIFNYTESKDNLNTNETQGEDSGLSKLFETKLVTDEEGSREGYKVIDNLSEYQFEEVTIEDNVNSRVSTVQQVEHHFQIHEEILEKNCKTPAGLKKNSPKDILSAEGSLQSDMKNDNQEGNKCTASNGSSATDSKNNCGKASKEEENLAQENLNANFTAQGSLTPGANLTVVSSGDGRTDRVQDKDSMVYSVGQKGFLGTLDGNRGEGLIENCIREQVEKYTAGELENQRD